MQYTDSELVTIIVITAVLACVLCFWVMAIVNATMKMGNPRDKRRKGKRDDFDRADWWKNGGDPPDWDGIPRD